MNMKISRKIRSESGFTLIEAIVSLILVGIMAAVAGMGVIYIVQGFVFTRANAATLQKGQIAMSRITLELKNISLISSPSTVSSLTFYSFKNDFKSKRSIQLNSDKIEITESYTDGVVDDYYTLTDQVEANTGLKFQYYANYGDTTECYPPSAKVIVIKLRLIGADGIVMELIDKVTPRNI